MFFDLLSQAAEALDHLHRHTPPVVHGDVKPSNLILTGDGRLVLVDFGIAGAAMHAPAAGTAGYLAPEILVGAWTPAVDVFGLAATAWTLETYVRHRTQSAELAAGTPAEHP